MPALTAVFSKALAGGVSNVSFSSLSADLGRTMYEFKFRIPPYYTLLVRSLSVLEARCMLPPSGPVPPICVHALCGAVCLLHALYSQQCQTLAHRPEQSAQTIALATTPQCSAPPG